jgi:hypothetical protein
VWCNRGIRGGLTRSKNVEEEWCNRGGVVVSRKFGGELENFTVQKFILLYLPGGKNDDNSTIFFEICNTHQTPCVDLHTPHFVWSCFGGVLP